MLVATSKSSDAFSRAFCLLRTSAHCGMPIFLKVNHQLESRMPEIGPSGSEGGAKISFAPTPIVRERSPSRRDSVTMYSRVSLQRSCGHVLGSVMESTAAPTQSSCPSGTDRFFLRHSRHFVPSCSHKSLRDNKSPSDNN